MKAGMFVLLLFIACLRVSAQFQELEQLKLNLEKLAQLKLSLSEMKRGYQVLQNGYNGVRDAARGNYDLHKNYLDGLLQVNNVVKTSPALVQVFSTQKRLLQEYKTGWQRIVSSNLFSVQELADIRTTYQFVIDQVSNDLETIDAVLSPGRLRMNDAERLSVVEKVKTNVAGNLKEVLELNQESNRVMLLRLQQRKDMDAVRRLNGIK